MKQEEYEKRIASLEAQLEEKNLLIEALQKTTDQYFALLEKMPSLAWIKDADHKLTYLNPAFENAFGIKREEWLGKSGWDLFPKEQAQAMAENDQKVFDSKDMIRVIETVSLVDKVYHYLSYKFPFVMADGEVFIAGISIDISAQVQAEQELTQNYQKLSSVQESKDKFIALLSHDLRSPIANLVTASQMLEEDLQSVVQSSQLKSMQRFRQRSQSLLELLNNMISWYHQDNYHFIPHYKKVDIQNVLKNVVVLFETQLEQKGIELRVHNSVQEELDLEERLFATLLRNILSNAIKFSPEKGLVTLEVMIKDNKLVVSIEDQGEGISDTENLFGNIWKSGYIQDKDKGTGFGLALCKEIVDKLDGEIWHENRKPHGLKLSFSLPLEETTQKVYQLIYQSQAIQTLDSQELKTIFKSVASELEQADVKGIMIYHNQCFCHLLEGRKKVVDMLYNQLRIKTYHTNVVTSFDTIEKEALFATTTLLDTRDKDAVEVFSKQMLVSEQEIAKVLKAFIEH